MTRRVLLDAGNSSLKWAVVENGRWSEQGRSMYGDLSAMQAQLSAGTACFIASVAASKAEREIARVLRATGVEPVWLRAQAAFAGLRNGYCDPGQLGVDRWMALIGARQRTREAVVVVSAGTAMTVDALSAGGDFLGGLIVPGAGLMRRALLQGTARIADAAGECQTFPRCTADAVESGVVAALCGAIRQQHARLAESAGVKPRCLLTGGDAAALLPYLDLPAEHAPALVLEGIDCVAREYVS